MAEFWNSLSSLAFCVMAAIGLYWTRRGRLEPRFQLLYAAVGLIGIGSTAFHACLLYTAQLLDEVPMMYGMLLWAYIMIFMRRKAAGALAIGVFVLGTVSWTAVAVAVTLRHPVVAQVGFMVVILCSSVFAVQHYANEDAVGRHLFHCYILFGCLGALCWALDRSQCALLRHLPLRLPNPQLHAWWHVFMSLNCNFGAAFVAYARARYIGCRARLEPLPLHLPRVVHEPRHKAS